MRALIRQYPTNARFKENEEICFEDTWPAGTGENGEPYTLDGYKYALAQDAPEDAIPSDFDITTIEVPDTAAPAGEDGTAEVPTTTRRVAVFNTARYEARKAQDGAEYQPAPENSPAGADGAEEPPATIVVDGVEYTRAGSE